MIQTVILDLDGPILEGRFRHYACYEQILATYSYTPIALEKYWQMKRERVDRRQLLAASGAESIYPDFSRMWLDLIEQPCFLALDQLQPGVIEKLQLWRGKGLQLVLITLRRHSKHLNEQLVRLGIHDIFDYVLVSEYSGGGTGKTQQVKNVLTDITPQQCLWIGDTEVDIEGARALGCPIWAVTCGLRTESYLQGLSPDFLSADVTQVVLERW